MSQGQLSADNLAEIIECDYQANVSNNRNTVDELFLVDRIDRTSFNEFVNKFLVYNKFNYKEIKIEYDDEIQLLTYSFPSFIHLICTPILFMLFYKKPSNESLDNHLKNVKVSEKVNSHFVKRINHRHTSSVASDKDPIIIDRNNNLLVSYFQVNSFLSILMNSKNKVASLNKDLLIIPDGVIINPQLLTEPIFAIEITNWRNIDKMRYKLSHSYTRFKKPNNYKTILLLILDDAFDVQVEVWKKIPLPREKQFDIEKLTNGYLNIPNCLDRSQELEKAAVAVRNAQYLNLNPEKHKYTYYLQNRAFKVSYDSCTFQERDAEMQGIPIHYHDIHLPADDQDAHAHANSIVTLHLNEIRTLIGHLIRRKLNDLRSDVACLHVAESIRTRAKKTYSDLCDLEL